MSIPPSSTQQLIAVLNGSSSDPINITGLYPRYSRLPGVAGGIRYMQTHKYKTITNSIFRYQGNSDQYVNVQLHLRKTYLPDNVTIQQEWWELTQDQNPYEPCNSLFPTGNLNFVTISTSMPSAITTSLVSAGIIGLCILIFKLLFSLPYLY